MKLLNKLSEWFKKKIKVDYYLVEVMPRAWYERRDVGGMRITMRFVKTITQFGRTKTEAKTETFNNYHDHRGNFTFNPTYVPAEDAHGEDELWHSILVWEDCEKYPFCRVTTPFLRGVIDDWFKKEGITCGGEWKA